MPEKINIKILGITTSNISSSPTSQITITSKSYSGFLDIIIQHKIISLLF